MLRRARRFVLACVACAMHAEQRHTQQLASQCSVGHILPRAGERGRKKRARCVGNSNEHRSARARRENPEAILQIHWQERRDMKCLRAFLRHRSGRIANRQHVGMALPERIIHLVHNRLQAAAGRVAKKQHERVKGVAEHARHAQYFQLAAARKPARSEMALHPRPQTKSRKKGSEARGLRKQFFSDEKNQKTFFLPSQQLSGEHMRHAATANGQKSFGSFLQKRTASFKSLTL